MGGILMTSSDPNHVQKVPPSTTIMYELRDQVPAHELMGRHIQSDRWMFFNVIPSFVLEVALGFEYGLSFADGVDKNCDCTASCISEEMISSWEILSWIVSLKDNTRNEETETKWK